YNARQLLKLRVFVHTPYRWHVWFSDQKFTAATLASGLRVCVCMHLFDTLHAIMVPMKSNDMIYLK
uniref:Uncharacterized protein n=1 Tax=Glossina morsitans morsitans TaxID=37546 RepID=A0A1B0FGF8_GLOMM